MTHDPNAPVIVGAAATQQRFEDPRLGADALGLMRAALQAAAEDAGGARVIDAVGALLVPQGTWSAANPAAHVMPDHPGVQSIVADLGVLQQTLLDRACTMVASGRHDVVVVCGGEAKYRALRSQITGIASPGGDARPDTEGAGDVSERMTPAHEVITAEEIARGLPVPARQYAMIDTAIRAADGLHPDSHIAQLAALWSGFSEVAAGNDAAWNRSPIGPADLAAAPMLAWPYTKLHCSQWNVDQAAAIIVCSAGAAARLGIPQDRWVFAHLGVESNLMVPMTLRAEVHRSPAIAVAGDVVRDRLGVEPGSFDIVDLYSCFPAAVRMQARELRLDPQRALTITGGMTFGGGPFNNYTLQSLVAAVHRLRADPAATGMVTNVSGMLTKFGLSIWSCRPPAAPFAAIDVTGQATSATPTVALDPHFVGQADVVTYTVAFDRGSPTLGIALGDSAAGPRVLSTTDDAATMDSMLHDDWIGRRITVDGGSIV